MVVVGAGPTGRGASPVGRVEGVVGGVGETRETLHGEVRGRVRRSVGGRLGSWGVPWPIPGGHSVDRDARVSLCPWGRHGQSWKKWFRELELDGVGGGVVGMGWEAWGLIGACWHGV